MKFTAVLNVIAWGGFWAFGYLALTENPANSHEILIAGALAALGGGVGVFTFLRCARSCDTTGYSETYKRAPHDEAIDA